MNLTAESMTVQEYYQGFRVIQIKFEQTYKYPGQIFWKPHISSKELNMVKPIGRTLFVINLPPYITKSSLFHIMEDFGKVEDVFLHKKPSPSAPPEVTYPLLFPQFEPEGYKIGYVVFEDSSAINKAMAHPSEKVLIASTEKHKIITGEEKWFAEYNDQFVDENELKEEVEHIMVDYEEQKVKEALATSNQPDEDGWITVSNSKKRPNKKTSESRPGNPKRKRRKKVQLNNFYAFQQKEINMQHLEEKRKKFEEDGKRMAMLRKSRKFKPL